MPDPPSSPFFVRGQKTTRGVASGKGRYPAAVILLASRAGMLVAVLLVALAIGAYAWWREGGKRRFFPRNWGVVHEGWLFRSGQIHPRIVEQVLREHRIDVVIDLADDRPGRPSDAAERRAVEALGIRKVDLPGLNGHGVGRLRSYSGALTEMVRAREAGERVLVHCAAGSERTGGAIALYRMLFEGWSGEEAYAEYLSYRSTPPEEDVLAEYLNPRMGRLVKQLLKSGALKERPAELPRFGP